MLFRSRESHPGAVEREQDALLAPGEEQAADQERRKLGDVCQEVLTRTGDDITSAVRSMASIDTSFVVALAQSERFGSLCMSRYLDQVDEATSLQFSAVTIGLPGGDLLISFPRSPYGLFWPCG